MADPAKAAADLERLKAARRSGVLRIQDGEQSIFYRDDAELTRQIATLEAELGLTPPRTIAVRSDKGWLK